MMQRHWFPRKSGATASVATTTGADYGDMLPKKTLKADDIDGDEVDKF